MQYEELVKVILGEYDNDARQLAAQSELERLTFEQAMLEVDSNSLDCGLTFLVDKINVLTPQAPPEFRLDDHKKGSSERQFSTPSGPRHLSGK